MLKLKPYKESPRMCGPATLKIVLEYYGVKKSEKELAKLCGTIYEKGIGGKGIANAARKLGFKAEIRDNAALADIRRLIRKKIPVIVDWFSETEGHYSAVAGIDRKNIYLMDPEIAGIKKMDLETFCAVWFDFPGKFIKSRNDLVLRRMIVVYK